MKAKTSPLLVSMLLHIAVLLLFVITKNEMERIFIVELTTKESMHGNIKTFTGRIHDKKNGPFKNVVKGENSTPRFRSAEPVLNTAGARNTDNQKSEILPVPENPSFSISENIPSDHVGGDGTGRAVLTSGRSTSGFHDKDGSGSVAVKGNNSGNDIVESEFGSSNGPSFLKTIKPEYPRLARRLGREGKVVLRLFIDEHGRLLKVEVIEKAGHGFDEAAVEAVKASTFRSAKMNGMPVACKAVLPVRFRLE